MKKINELVNDYHMYVIFLITAAGFFGTLYFSEVAGLPPCTLCWYQRILLYPIFFLSGASLVFKEKFSSKFIMLLSIPGVFIALYHYLYQKTDLVPKVINCVQGVPCDAIDFEILGFITIPFLSMLAFIVISLVSFIRLRSELREESLENKPNI